VTVKRKRKKKHPRIGRRDKTTGLDSSAVAQPSLEHKKERTSGKARESYPQIGRRRKAPIIGKRPQTLPERTLSNNTGGREDSIERRGESPRRGSGRGNSERHLSGSESADRRIEF